MGSLIQAPPSGMVYATTDPGAGPIPFNQYSVIFDGINDHVSMGNVLGFDLNTPFSLSIWFKTTAAGQVVMLAKRDDVLPNRVGYQASFNAVNNRWNLSLCAIDNVNELEVIWTQAPGQFNDGNWHHLCWTYAGVPVPASIALYLDNVSRALTTLNNSLTLTIVNALPFMLACRNGVDLWYDGNEDEISVWNKALSIAEVNEIYNGGVPADLLSHSATGNLMSWWRMGDGDVFPTLNDNKGARNGTMINMVAGDIIPDVPP